MGEFGAWAVIGLLIVLLVYLWWPRPPYIEPRRQFQIEMHGTPLGCFIMLGVFVGIVALVAAIIAL